MLIDRLSDVLPTVENHAHWTADPSRCQVTIDILTDDTLLYVFDFYVAQASKVEAWLTLVHVCRRWRTVVFGSPRRLNMRIECTTETLIKKKLGMWPALPIFISGSCTSHNIYTVEAALKHHDRVCQIKLDVECDLSNITPLLEKPFPILTELHLNAHPYHRSFDPDPSKFLGGGSAHLRSLSFSGTGSHLKIRDLSKLLLCGPNLVILRLDSIYDPFSFLPDEFVTVLSALPILEELVLHVIFDRSLPKLENRRLPLLTRTVLPSLAMLKVKVNYTEDLEEFVARLDAPLLVHLYIHIVFTFSESIVLDTPQLLCFISRIPKLQPPLKAHIGFRTGAAEITFFFPGPFYMFKLEIFSYEKKERQLTCLAQFCRSVPFPVHPLDTLRICRGQFRQQCQQNHTKNTGWPEVLRQFAGAKNLYLAKEFALHIAHALQELVGERVMEALPILENVFIEEFQPSGHVHEVIKGFVAARQLAGHPITISRFEVRKC